MADELIDIVDESGRVLRQAMKTEAHRHGWLHKTVIGYVRHGNSWRLVRQTADRQDAGQLVAPVGGHVQAGESDIAALLRESEEEIGVRKLSYTEIGRARFHRQVIGRDENHLFIIYEITPEVPIVLGSEAESIEDFTDAELRQAIMTRPDDFGDAYYFVLERFYRDYLAPTWVSRWS